MNAKILNRAGTLPEDGFYQIEAIGEHINHRARVVQVIDAKAVESIVNRFTAEAQGENFAGQQIYRDHLGNSEENSTEAFGWAMELRNRAGVPEARIAWTALGLPLIKSEPTVPPAYKFFSTEYEPSECEKIGTRIINRKTYAVVRPLRLDGLSLTNDPNNKGQRPISNRNGNSASADDENKTSMKVLLKKLGLAEDASEESAVAALQNIQNRASQVETLNTELTTLRTAQVENDLEKYKNRFKPANREKIKASLISNRAGTIELLEATEAPTGEADATRITNRGASKTPAAGAADQADAGDDQARAEKISNRASELKAATPTRSFDACWKQASKENATA